MKKKEVTGGFTDAELKNFRDGCLGGASQRHGRYDRYRSLIFNNNQKNLLWKHLKDSVSLIYLPDNILFDITAGDIELTHEQSSVATKLRNRISEKFISEGYDMKFYDWLFWSAVYDCYFVKCIIDGDKVDFRGVSPYDFYVLYEDVDEIDKNQVFLHTVRIPAHLARKKYPGVVLTEVPPPQRAADRFQEIVYSQNQVTLTAQQEYIEAFNPKKIDGYVEVQEMWLWSEEMDDYLMVQFVGDRIYKIKNPFLPKQHPFIKICFNSVEGYFWGISELYYLAELHKDIVHQDKVLKYLQDMLLNPPLIVYGLSGSIESQEIQKAIKQPGTVSEIVDPVAKFDFYLPKLDPAFALRMREASEATFKEQSGIMGVIAGRPMPNVRSANYASILAQFASTQLKEKALRVEFAIEAFMTLFANCYISLKEEFAILNGLPLRVDVFAHTSSPITALTYQDMLLTLAETGIIPPAVLIDLLPLPKKDEIKKAIKVSQ